MPYKTTIKIEIISEYPVEGDIQNIAAQMVDGDYSGDYEITDVKELNNQETAIALQAQGSDPEFILGEDGWKWGLHKGDEITVNGEVSKIIYIEYKRGAGHGSVDLMLENGNKYNCLSMDEIS